MPRDWIVAHASWTQGMEGEHKRDKLRALGEYEPRCADGILPLSAATENRTSSDRARYWRNRFKNLKIRRAGCVTDSVSDSAQWTET